MTRRILVALTLIALLLWPAAAFAQHPLNIPDFCLGSPDTVAPGQTRVISGTVTVDCLRIETGAALRLSPGATLRASTIFGLPGARLEAGTEADPLMVLTSIVIRDTPLESAASDPEQFGHGLIWFGVVRIHGAVKTPFVRTAFEPLAGQTALALSAAPSGWQAGDRLLIPGTSQVWDQEESETPLLQAVSGSSVTLQTPLVGAHRGARFVDGSIAFLPHVGNLTRTVVIRSENPAGVRGHVLVSDRADVDIRYAAFLDLGRTTTDPLGTGNQLGRYSLHLHHLFGPTAPQANGYQYTLIGNVVAGGSKWGITIHNTHYGLVKDNIAYRNGGAQIMTEDGSETGNIIEGNLMVGATGPSTDENQIHLGREQSGLWLRGPSNIIRNNVVAHLGGNAYVLVNASGPSNVGGIVKVPTRQGANPHIEGIVVDNAQAALAEWSGNEFYSTRWGVILWDANAACCTEVHDGPTSTIAGMKGWHVRAYGIFPYATNRLTLDGWTLVNDPAFTGDSLGASGTYFGDYLSRNFILRRSRIENFHNGIFPPIKAGDTRDIYGTSPGTVLVEDTILRNFVNLRSTMPYGVTGGGAMIPPRVITLRRVTSQPVAGGAHVRMEYDLQYGPNVNAVVLQRVLAEAFNGSGDFEVFYREQAPSFITPQSDSVPGLVGSPVAGQTNAQNWAARSISVAGSVAPCTTVVAGFEGFVCGGNPPPPVQSLPSVSTITPMGGPTTNPQGQQLWKFSSVESPNWDTARWGTATHRFNVVVQPGSGPLPVYLELHSAGDNGYHEPEEAYNSTEPAIHILPVDLGYFDGIVDPATGQQRFYSKWSGYKDAAGLYQPVTSDRIVRYVQWALAQTGKWTADLTRVYVRGQSMGGGGAQHLGLQYPPVFAGIISSTGWIDTTAWASDRGDCLPGVRWKAATGPLCTEMLDTVFLVQRAQTKPTLFLTWNTNDSFVNPARYPELVQTLEATSYGYIGEWRQDDHNPFALPGNPHLDARVGTPLTLTTPNGSTLTAPTGSRRNVVSGNPPTDPDSDGDGVTDSRDKCPGTAPGTPVDPATGCPLPPPQGSTVTVNAAVRHQVMREWESAVLASRTDWDNLTQAQIDAGLDLAILDLGIGRARLSVRPVLEGNGTTFANDNADPNVINLAGFNFTALDEMVTKYFVPARQRAQSRGERFVTVLQCSCRGQSDFENPAEYAEFTLAIFQHMRDTFGFTPEVVDIVLEPDGNSAWTGTLIGQQMVAIAQRLQAAGFTPEFAAPAVTVIQSAPRFLDEMYAVPGAKALTAEVSYHRYGGADDGSLAARAVADGKRLAMTEAWSTSTDANALHHDITVGRNSSWQKGIFFDEFGCQFGQTIGFSGGATGTPQLCAETVAIRQYMKWVRPGAQRIGLSNAAGWDGVAFQNADGRHVVVVRAEAGGTVSVAGLPPGTYGRSYTVGSTFTALADVTITAAQPLQVTIPDAGVLTVVELSAPPPPPVDTTPPVVALVVPPSPLKDTITITATCSDNVACIAVRLDVDGQLVSEDLTAPYAFTFNTLTVSNASHTFRVIGRDAAGNTAETSTVRDIDNFTPPPPTDTDKDGIPDSADKCPTVPAPGTADGCPVPPLPQTVVTQTARTCTVTLAARPPDLTGGWSARIRNMGTGQNIGTGDAQADADGWYRPYVNSLTIGQTYSLAIRWTKSGQTAQMYPATTVLVGCGG